MQQRWMRILQIGLLLMVCSLHTVACEPKATEGNAPANDERWKNFQETNQKEVAGAMSAYEKRQQQLAEKKKAPENKTDAKATPSAPESAPKK
jgi:hypothetical protein